MQAVTQPPKKQLTETEVYMWTGSEVRMEVVTPGSVIKVIAKGSPYGMVFTRDPEAVWPEQEPKKKSPAKKSSKKKAAAATMTEDAVKAEFDAAREEA